MLIYGLLLNLVNGNALVHDSPVCILQADTVSAGLDNNGLFLDSADVAHDTVDHSDCIARNQSLFHLFLFLLTLLVGNDHQEIHCSIDPAGGAPHVLIEPAGGVTGEGADMFWDYVYTMILGEGEEE